MCVNYDEPKIVWKECFVENSSVIDFVKISKKAFALNWMLLKNYK